jgi:pantoate--beta-alanine ligase
LIETGERSAAIVRKALAERILAVPGVALDYAAVIDADTLEPRDPLCGTILLAVAAHIGATRLIDNGEVQIR